MRIPGERFLAAAYSPVWAGFLAVLLIGVGILFLGDFLLRREIVWGVESQQERDVARIGLSLHYSGLDLKGAGAGERLPEIVATGAFHADFRRALFGMDVGGATLYSLDGAVLYSPDAAPVLGDDAARSPEFASARRGEPAARSGKASVPEGDGSRTTQVVETYGLVRSQPPGSREAGSPLAIVAVWTDVGDRLASARVAVWWIAAVFVTGLVAVLAVVQWVSQRSRSRLEAANETLRRRNIAISESRERMLRADEAAKQAIAEELHGNVQTKLYAVWMKLEDLRSRVPEGENELDEEVAGLAEEVDTIREEDIRHLSHRLHPGVLRIGALAGIRSLRDFYERMVPIELHAGEEAEALEPAGESVIPAATRLGMYRIAELALGNVVKHAAASTCTLRWDYAAAAGALTLVIEDAGAGFDTGEYEGGGLGLMIMNDYADSMGGELTITSVPGEGTRVEATIPFEPGPLPAAEERPEQ